MCYSFLLPQAVTVPLSNQRKNSYIIILSISDSFILTPRYKRYMCGTLEGDTYIVENITNNKLWSVL